MKCAIAIISFGTTYPAARAAIERLEQALAAQHPNHTPFRAFTSRMVIRIMEQKEGIRVETPTELLERLAREGYEEVLCQSLHVINGDEFTGLKETMARYAGSFQSLRLGAPLLTKSEDYEACVDTLVKELPFAFGAKEEALVLMGHGTSHFSNASYCQMENTFRYKGYENVYVATVEGFPGLDYALGRLKRKPEVTKVCLSPFMVVAGDHAQNDLAGEEPDSWCNLVEGKGYTTRAVLKGLGEYAGIEQIFCSHCKQAEELASKKKA